LPQQPTLFPIKAARLAEAFQVGRRQMREKKNTNASKPEQNKNGHSATSAYAWQPHTLVQDLERVVHLDVKMLDHRPQLRRSLQSCASWPVTPMLTAIHVRPVYQCGRTTNAQQRAVRGAFQPAALAAADWFLPKKKETFAIC
jgi:hypothetical protein